VTDSFGQQSQAAVAPKATVSSMIFTNVFTNGYSCCEALAATRQGHSA
jgi:hypothetical protein